MESYLPLHTVVETSSYLRDAERLGISSAIRSEIVVFVSSCPEAGDEVVGSGGVRKFRFAGRGKGKSGGYRIMSVFLGQNWPVYLLAVLSKGERANFTQREIAQFRSMTTEMRKQRGKPL